MKASFVLRVDFLNYWLETVKPATAYTTYCSYMGCIKKSKPISARNALNCSCFHKTQTSHITIKLRQATLRRKGCSKNTFDLLCKSMPYKATTTLAHLDQAIFRRVSARRIITLHKIIKRKSK